jgi:tetratricopeptide (TPR) repeat protein
MQKVNRHDSLDTPSCNPQLDEAAFANAPLTSGGILGRLPCDAWHHHYHYQASAQYLWWGEVLLALGHPEAHSAFTKAVFQDHSNPEAIRRKAGDRSAPHAPTYASHPASDAAFCMSIDRPLTQASRLHDEAIGALAQQEYPAALALLERAITCDANHSNSHFARGKCFFLQYLNAPDTTYLAEADMALTEAIRLSHRDHDSYHRQASADHVARGALFLMQGNTDLAVADFSKALDLFAKNDEARRLRAQAYRAKGNLLLAQADEAACQ